MVNGQNMGNNQRNKLAHIVLIISIVFLNIGCDQVSKTIVRKKIAENEVIKLWYPHLTLTKVENSGAFLSFGSSLSSPVRFIILSILPCIALILGLVFLFTKTNLSKTLLVGICFVIGGGLGNVYDRILYGSVTDFIHIDFIVFETGVFNLADLSIMVGMVIIVYNSWFVEKNDVQSLEGENS